MPLREAIKLMEAALTALRSDGVRGMMVMTNTRIFSLVFNDFHGFSIIFIYIYIYTHYCIFIMTIMMPIICDYHGSFVNDQHR